MDKKTKIKDLIANEPNEKERAKIKAQELAKETLNTFTKRGIEVETVEQPTLEKDCVKVVIKATKNGKELKVNNPYYFYNPTYVVNTGATTTVHSDVLNIDIQMPITEENPQEALKNMIIDVLESQEKRGKI